MADSRQRLRDIGLLLKHSRKAQVIGGVVIFFLIWGFFGSNPPKRAPQRVVEDVEVGTAKADAQGNYIDLITRFDKDLREIKEATISNKEANEETRQKVAEFDNRTAEIFRKLIERITDIETSEKNRVSAPLPPENVTTEDFGNVEPASLEAFGGVTEEEVLPPAQPEREKIAFIGAGDSVRVRLLAGVHAPTDGTPYPVVFKLVGDVDGPDGSALPLGEARLIAAAQGSLPDQRVLFRLTSLNVRYPDGSRNIVPVDGWVVGEDGIRGMEGMMIDPMARAIAGSLMSGTLQGAGTGIQQGNTQRIITQNGQVLSNLDGSLAEYALAGGLSKAGRNWGRFIDERAAQLVPHVKVLSGREATAVFSKSVEVPGLYDSIANEEFAFASLD